MTELHPLTPDRWDDFAALCRQMGPNRSCWCAWWWEAPGEPRTEPRRATMARAVEAGPPPGLLLAEDETPVGWVAVGPRAGYRRLAATRDTRLDPADTGPGTDDVWAVPCFFVAPSHRGRGHLDTLLEAAVAFAADHGAGAVDGVPVDPSTRARSDAATYTGTVSVFVRHGFRELARRTRSSRVIVRRELR